MSRFIIHSHTSKAWQGLAFDSDRDRLVCLGPSTGVPDFGVQAFDPRIDVFYHTPEPLPPESLAQEVAIHYPQSLVAQLTEALLPSTLATAMLIQRVGREAPYLSPLAALATLLDRLGSVNAALLECDNDGMLFLRKAGTQLTAHFSARASHEYLKLEPAVRALEFPDFDADEMILGGTDLSSESRDVPPESPLTDFHSLSLTELMNVCDFTDEGLLELRGREFTYALAFGAALIVHDVRRQA